MSHKVIQNAPMKRLTCKPQIREWMGEESLTGLAQSIKESGILQPILVRREGSEFIVIEGHRRMAAAKMAGLTHVPVVIDDRELSEAEALFRQFVTNCQREDLPVLDKARAVQRLMKAMNWNAAETAVKLGISPSMVSKLLKVLELPAEVQEQIATGAIGLSAAYAIAQAPGPAAQSALASEVARGAMTREEVAARAKSRKRRRSPTRRQPDSKRERIVIPLCGSGSVAVPVEGLTLEGLLAGLMSLIERLKASEFNGFSLADVFKAISTDERQKASA